MATTVTAAFDELLRRLTLTENQREAANNHANNVKEFLNDNLVLAKDGAWVTGSFSRGTLTRWQRDVDLMAALSVAQYDSTYGDDSREFLYFVRSKLNEEYQSTKVSSRQISVKLEFSDFDVDVAPCFRREGGGYLIPNGSHGWKATNPPFHFRLMRDANVAHDNQLKPLVRLLKAWNIANGNHLGSIHVELMTERMWRDQRIGVMPASVASSLKVMPGWLNDLFPDPWEKGDHIDGDLSDSDRQVAVRMLREDADRAAEAEELRAKGRYEEAIDRWGIVYQHKFPAYG